MEVRHSETAAAQRRFREAQSELALSNRDRVRQAREVLAKMATQKASVGEGRTEARDSVDVSSVATGERTPKEIESLRQEFQAGTLNTEARIQRAADSILQG